MYRFTCLLLVVAVITGCRKSGGDGFLKGKVIRISCASFVIQVIGPNIGENNWKDIRSRNDNVYNNVLNVTNYCTAIPTGVDEGNYIRFRISTDRPGCLSCYMYDAPPAVAYSLRDISLVE